MLEISFIVPVYNVEKYLRRCVDSLLQQNLDEDQFEIILVDDGSPDDCGKICDEYSSRNNSILTIHTPNQGLSEARNTGVSAACGKYIQFVDSDDYLAANMVPAMLMQIKSQDLDVLRFNYENVNEDEEIIHPNKTPKKFADYSNTVTDGLTFLSDRLGYECYACQFIIERSIASNFPFMTGIHFEDTEWVSRMLPTVNRISSTPEVVYFYRTRSDSITKGKEKGLLLKNIEDRLKIITLLKERGRESSRPDWFDGMVSHMTVSLLSLVGELTLKEHKSVLKSLNKLNVYPLSSHKMTRQAKRKILLINISPSLFCFIYRLRHTLS